MTTSDTGLAEQAASYEKGAGVGRPRWALPAGHYTDNALAERVAEHWMDGRWRWCPELGWRQWDRRRWIDRNAADVLELVRTYVRALLLHALERMAEAVKLADPAAQKEAEALVGKARSYQATAKILAVAKLLPGQPPVRCEPAEFDAHPDLLNVANGVVNLRTGELGRHDPALMLSKITEVAYAPGAVHRRWTQALTSVTPEVAEYLRRRLGQSATGYTPEDAVVLVLQGVGENGKSALLAGIQRALGEHATYISEKVLLAQTGDSHTTEVMDLLGARLAVHEELPDGRHLDMKRIKAATSPVMKARRMRCDPVQFATTHALVVSTNHRPQVAETDHGTWRRLQLVPFPFRYRKPGEPVESPADRTGDPGVIRELEHGTEVLPAVLAWLVSGAVAWYAADRVLPLPPAEVAAATEQWREGVDRLGDFIASWLVADPGWHIAATDLTEAYNAANPGSSRINEQTLADRLRHHRLLPAGVEKRRTRGSTGTRAGTQVSRPDLPTGSRWITGPPALPPTYHAWVGVRFADRADVQADDDNSGGATVTRLPVPAPF